MNETLERILTEKDAENLLEKEGFEVIKRALIKDSKDIEKVTKQISLPWAMKISSKKIIHKAKIGGVILNIKTIDDAKKAFNKLSKIKDFEEVLIQPMIKNEPMLILGLKKTPEFGTVIMLGKGGSFAEKEKDVSFRALPISEKDAEQMIKEIKFYKELKEKNINLSAIKEGLLKLSKLAKKYPKISELDINPAVVTQGKVIVIDARIILED